MRITVAPARDGALAAQVEWREVPPGAVLPDSGSSPGGGTSLVSIAVPGGLGAHKWVDRRLLDEAQASLPDRALPLITDEDGNVLEASRANLFVVRDGALSTPPLDGRILPGITRVRVSEIAAEMGIERREARLTRDDLLTADEVFLTGSVRGIERARQLDGALLGTDGGIAARLAAELRAAQRGGSLTSSSVTR
jgi:para-aminobenzoate synthetase/4-amino-4-deoxychorismate lyase